MVIKVQIQDLSVKWVLVNPDSSVDILYWDAFKGMNMDTSELLSFKGTLVGFSGGIGPSTRELAYHDHFWEHEQCQRHQSKISDSKCIIAI